MDQQGLFPFAGSDSYSIALPMSDDSAFLYNTPPYNNQRVPGSTGSVSDDSDNYCDLSLSEIHDVLNDSSYTAFNENVFDEDNDEWKEPIPLHPSEYGPYPSFIPSGQYPSPMIANSCVKSPYGESNCLYWTEGKPPASPTDAQPHSPALSSSSDDSCTPSLTSRSPKEKRKAASAKSTLPKFMCQTIKNKEYNPTHIKWLNEKEGIFLIVKPKAIAELWGEQKGNPKMKYPSMSRGIRERRKYGYFDRVPQDPRYPKKLTYKFGPMVADYLKK